MKAIVADRLFDSEAGVLRSNQAVLIEGGLIVSVESDTGLPAVGSDQRLEFPGSTLLPGLIDCHVHLAMDGGSAIGSDRPADPATVAILGTIGAAATVRAGVTTVRCVGTPANVDLVLRDAVAAGRIIGPRIVAAGRPIAMTGGHAHAMAIEVDGADAITAAVRSQVKAGVDVIKLMVTGGVLTPGIQPGTPQLTRDELQAAISIAHRAGRRVCGHAEGSEGVRDAIECGIDSIEHGLFDRVDALFDIMRRQGTTLVPTLIAYQAILEGRDALAAEAVTNAELAIQRNQDSFVHAIEAGVNLAMGSDAGTPFNPHGANWREVELMVALGLPPTAALQAATTGGANLLGLRDTGRIGAGFVADLLVVRGNPVDEIAALADVEAVWSAGRRVSLDTGGVS